MIELQKAARDYIWILSPEVCQHLASMIGTSSILSFVSLLGNNSPRSWHFSLGLSTKGLHGNLLWNVFVQVW